MKREYKIFYEPIDLPNGEKKDKHNVYYYINGIFETKEFHSLDGINGDIRNGYILNNNLIKTQI